MLQAMLAQRRTAPTAMCGATPRRPRPGGLLAAFDERLPFELTAGQRAVGEQIADELAREHPMHRLLQGEVGSGKTVVALRAMLAVIDAGGQAALLAPTEVLAAQHHRSISRDARRPRRGRHARRQPRSAPGSCCSPGASRPPYAREAPARRRLGRRGHRGRHARADPGARGVLRPRLVVVDEQHRFGVEQRDALRGKGNHLRTCS